MQRAVMIIVVVVGFTGSVGVAIGCMLWGGEVQLAELEPRRDFRAWPRPVPADWPSPTARTVYRSTARTMVLHNAVHYADAGYEQPAGTTHYQWLHQFGWPLRALEAEVRTEPGGQYELYAMLGPVPDAFRPRRGSLRHIPLRPLWPGLLVDSALYAAVVWSVVVGFVSLVRLSRLRRGRCPRCKYLFGSSERCPECGTRIVPAS